MSDKDKLLNSGLFPEKHIDKIESDLSKHVESQQKKEKKEIIDNLRKDINNYFSGSIKSYNLEIEKILLQKLLANFFEIFGNFCMKIFAIMKLLLILVR